eukprot:855323_1
MTGDMWNSQNTKKYSDLIGTKCNIYDTKINQWLPGSVTNSNDKKIKVRYDGCPAKYDEWIRVDGGRYASLHHSTLILESKKRKTESGNAGHLFRRIERD